MPSTHNGVTEVGASVRHWFTDYGWQQFEPVLQPVINASELGLDLLTADPPPGSERYRDKWQVAMRLEE